jgi:hypothetical protein
MTLWDMHRAPSTLCDAIGLFDLPRAVVNAEARMPRVVECERAPVA